MCSTSKQQCAHHLLGHVLESAVMEGRLQAHAGHTVPQVLVILQRPPLDHLVRLCLYLPGHEPIKIISVLTSRDLLQTLTRKMRKAYQIEID